MRERSLVEIHCFETLESLLVYCIKIHANIICFFIELKTDVGVAPGDGGEKKLLHKQPMEHPCQLGLYLDEQPLSYHADHAMA